MSVSNSQIQIQPALIQLLESYQRAGVKSVPLPKPVPVSNLPANQSTASSSVRVESAATTPEHRYADRHADRYAERRAGGDGSLHRGRVATRSASTTPNSQIMNQSLLTACAQQVAQCIRCQELADFRTQTVFGVGDPNADIMFVGEAPGEDEDKQGEPFVGRAGQLLNRIIAACNMRREQIYICNILKCHPPNNRNPSGEEAANCREYLDLQIEQVQPTYIVCWGAIAAQNLLNSTQTIGRLRGQFYDHNGIKVLCTYHPSYLLRNPSAKMEVWKDMKFLFADMGITLQNKQNS